MKKYLSDLSFIILSLALNTGFAIATPVQPYRCTYVPAAYGRASAPVLDGIVDDVYGGEQSTDWIYPDQQSTYGGPDDFTAVFHLCYDLDYLYMIAIITDDVEEYYDWSYSDPWMFDNVEVFLRLDTNTTYTAYDSLTVQLRICRGLDSVQEPGNVVRSEFGYYMETPTGTGWVTEVAIPWAAAADGGTLPEDFIEDILFGGAIGFDFSGADSDNTDGDSTTGNRDYQTAWDLDGQDGTEDQAWQNVTVFGYITFQLWMDNVAISVFNENVIKVYPNPANNTLRFEIEGLKSYEIYSINGTQVLAGETSGNVDISSLKSGLYVAQIGNESVRFVKE
jgi:hypothetical protein